MEDERKELSARVAGLEASTAELTTRVDKVITDRERVDDMLSSIDGKLDAMA